MPRHAAAVYTRATMSASHRHAFRTPGSGLLGPLNPPGYLTWLAVTLSPLLDWADTVAISPRLLVGLAGQLVFAPLFVARALLEERHAASPSLRWLLIGQAAAALAATWGFQDKMQGVLLVIVAAQLPAARSMRWSTVALSVANMLLLGILLELFPALKAIQIAIAYLAFQLFGALIAAYAYRAHAAREAALHINAELMATRRLLEEGTRIEERLRLSRELHDVIGHKLTALKLQMALQARGVTPTDAVLQLCTRLTDELLLDVRGVVSSLRESDGIDLHQALRALDPELPVPKVIFDLDSRVRVPDIRQAEAMLRSAQEGLTNALRHSGADEIRVVLTESSDGRVLSIEDDGSGKTPLQFGNGLRGLQERLVGVGGNLRIEPRARHGLRLSVTLPHEPVSA
jgi:signal transduction histidine kinase